MSVNSVSSSTLASILQNSVARLQSQLTTVQTESSTGLLADIGLTLGAHSGQDAALHQQMADLTAISTSNSVVSAQLDTASSALTSLQGKASTMLASFIKGQTATPGGTDATALQKQAAGALVSFASLMSASVGGVFVFGGINSGAAPIATYAQTPAGAAQSAIDSAFQSAFGFSVSSPNVNTITASQMTSFLDDQFAAQFSGANWSANWSSASDTPMSNRIGANQTIATSASANQAGFQKMAQALTMVSEFGGLGLSSDAYAALMNTAQSVMNAANSGLIATGAAVGTIQNQVKEASSAIALQQNVLTTQIDANESVNPYDVASQVTNLSTQLQTAYSLTAQIHKLSLVNFL